MPVYPGALRVARDSGVKLSQSSVRRPKMLIADRLIPLIPRHTSPTRDEFHTVWSPECLLEGDIVRRRGSFSLPSFHGIRGRHLSSTTADLLRKYRFRSLLRLRPQLFMPIEKTNTCVPAKNSVVVTCRPQMFRRSEELQRPAGPIVDIAAAPPSAGSVRRLRTSLPRNSGIVAAIVFRLQAGHRLHSASKRAALVRNLVREGEDQANARLAVGRINFEDVTADAFGLVRLIEEAVAFGSS